MRVRTEVGAGVDLQHEIDHTSHDVDDERDQFM